MSDRDQLRAAIDRLPDDRLAELSEFVRRLEEAPAPKPEPPADGRSIMEKLMSIKIDDLPPDFSENLDEYLYRERFGREDVP
ncbi:MAG: hypothetical protein K2X87_33145 [Gemmataceae bacterium]|nr:hypothetical protein [Gemmataceae bacterium]